MEPDALTDWIASLQKVATTQLGWMTEATKKIEKLERDVDDLRGRVRDLEAESA